IFGAIHDDKLNKNEIKITVIASGFPETARKKPMITVESKSGEGPRSIPEPGVERPAPTPKRVETGRAATPSNKIEEDDDWSSIPAFLRRSKKP
ncbi:MAG: hypothetical protein AAB455_03815, partial [Patescibacteria group bacterium]